MIKRHFKTIIPLLSFLFIASTVASTTLGTDLLFGPKKYKRTGGPHNHYTDTFKAKGGNGHLVIINGDADGDDRITSATLSLNGKKVFDHHDFKKHVPILERFVHFKAGTNTLHVELHSKPGGHITIKVIGAITPPPTVAISANPGSIDIGASSILTWSSTNATSCFIDQDIGSVPVSGHKTVIPTQTTTYTITATGVGGTIKKSVTVTVQRTPTVSFTASPQSISLGASSILTWSSTNATSCFIDQDIGSVPVSGNKTVTPTQTATYTITATGVGGTIKKSVTVGVSNPVGPPTVSLSASPNEITPGGSADLSWNSSGGQSAFIDNGVGVVALSGMINVRPENTTIYTLSVTGPGGSVSAEARVKVKGNAAPPPSGSFGEKYGELIPGDATIPAYDAKRFSMVTGLVQNISGAPLSGVTVFFHGRLEYGTAMTGNDGRFSIPIDGGTAMTLTYKKQGFITAQRQVHVPWNGFAAVETIKMISEDPVSTTFSFDGNPATVKAHQSTMHTDGFGARATTIVFTGDNRAYLTDKDGNPGQILNTITTRTTEFTTPESMPALLPPNSAYTFCTELTVDGAQRVKFQKPVVMWVENFLGFQVGDAVPVGYYDRDKAVWVPSKNGRVVRLLDSNRDGIVDAIDATGIGQPTDLNNNGSFADEAVGLDNPTKYPPGATYWRVEVDHFSPWDCNWPFGPPPDAIPPNPTGPPDTDSNPVDKEETSKTCDIGSYAEDRSRTVHEDIPIPGTEMTLHYSSQRAKGYKYTFSVPASGSAVPRSLKNIHVRVEIAGRTFEQVLPPAPHQRAEFSWDGLDVWGKRVVGGVNANISIGFEYGAFYYGVDSSANARAFAQAGVSITNISSRQSLFSWINEKMNISMPPTADTNWSHIAEGWTISQHHYLNPGNPTPLFRGDGSINSSNVYIITTVAGGSFSGEGSIGDGGPALLAKLNTPMDIAVDAEGNLYILDAGHNVIRKVDTAGIITTIAGGYLREKGYSGDGGPAVEAKLWLWFGGISVDGGGNIYFADYHNYRIRKIDPKGIITTVAGNGSSGYGGDGGFAVDAALGAVEDIALDNAGNLYIHHKAHDQKLDMDDKYIRKVDTNGIITTIAGNGPSVDQWCDNCSALNTNFDRSNNIALDSRGNLYIGDTHVHRIRKVDINGMISTVAGNGVAAQVVNDGPASTTPVSPVRLAADSSGNLFFFHYTTSTLHKVDTNGTITKVAGNGVPGYSGDGGPAINAKLEFGNIAVSARGDIYFTDYNNHVVRKIALALSRIDAAGDVHFTDGNGMAHVFSNTGSHKRSVDLNTGVVLKEFGYNGNGQLISIIDEFGRQVSINRDGNGNAGSIVSPDGITTNLTIDANRQLKEIRYPTGGIYRFEYTADGLLTAKTEPNGNRFGHSFDGNGRLVVASDEEGGNWQFNRTADGNGDTISTVTTGEGNVTHYRDRKDATGAVNSIITDSTGAVTTSFRSADGLTVNKSLSCGMNVSLKYDYDPRYKFKVVKEVTNSTPSMLRQSTAFSKIYTGANPDGTIDTITETMSQNNKSSIFEQNNLFATRTMTSPVGRIYTTFFDPANLLTTKLAIPGFFDTNYGYDRQGRLITVNREARTTTLSYNTAGFLASMTDPEMKTVSYGYDAIGRVTQITSPDGATVGFEYDANGNTTVIRPPSAMNDPAINHRFGYNKVNLNSAYATPSSGAYKYVYNRDKKLSDIIFPSGDRINNIYSGGKVVRMQTPEGRIDYTYLCGSKIGSMTKDSDTKYSEKITYAYDGSLLTSLTQKGTLNATLAYGYNDDFMPTSLGYAGGTTNYAYDDDGLLTGAGAFTITRDRDNGLPLSVTGGPFALNRTFNGYGEQIAEIYNVRGKTVATWNLDYTDTGRIKKKTEMVDGGIAATYDYTYDLAGRLTSVTKNGELAEEYRYGSNGARIYEKNVLRGIERSSTYSIEDHLISAKDYRIPAGDTTYQYDVDGFLQEKIQKGAVTTYHYSSRGELLKVTLPNGTFIEHTHDPLGRRIATKVDGVITEKYLWEGQTRLLAIYDGSDNVMMRFNYADGRLPYSMTSAEDTYYLTYDQVGSLRAITDSSGDIKRRVDYDTFGNIIADTNPVFNVLFGFAGGLHDPDTGLVRFGYRDYNPDIGRWTAKDPILFAGGDTDLYGYVTNDPVNWVDPRGLDATILINTAGGRGVLNGPTNGNWGGGCWSGGQYSCGGNGPGKAPPTDSGDECYERHDACYRHGKKNTVCNRTMVNELLQLPVDPRQWPRPPRPGTEGASQRFRNWAIWYFSEN